MSHIPKQSCFDWSKTYMNGIHPVGYLSIKGRKTFHKMAFIGFLALAVTLASFTSGCSLRSGGTAAVPRQGGTTPSTSGKLPRGTKPYTIRGQTYHPLLTAEGFREEGIASWYGKDFHGKKTANGERYDMYGMTAAHKLLPFNTEVKVTNKRNGKSIIVRINDRGPFVSNRVIDLTRTGAERLEMIAQGTAPVVLETLGAVPGLQEGDLKGEFYVQVGAFANESNARRLLAKLQREGKGGRISYSDELLLWRVQAGPFASLTEAENASDAMLGEFANNFVLAK